MTLILFGTAGFGVSELARAALRTGIAPGIRSSISREQSPHAFSRAVTLCFILGNALLVVSAAGAIATGLMLYRAAQ
ncbi:MAG: hypothetical protein PSY14_04225 [bacterium]|nr:hypothetical protein [bacterium]